eukprot:TRINITY_DN681_c0_g1_i4.p1 TRINITY_DN681_c0_g1~~TRINITY_DN681_c0_g1_i4.p1  ORF type:complete len:319 (+),score=61.20 TRINITY_DN681_c0_g1_i4:529-1485(+)
MKYEGKESREDKDSKGIRGKRFSHDVERTARCREHEGNLVNYFCGDCSSGPYCPECILSGLHKGHNVLPLKNAFDLIKSKISSQLVSCGQKLSIIEDHMQQIELEKNHILVDGEKIKGEVENAMIEFERAVAQKREVILQSIERLVRAHITDVDIDKNQLMHEKRMLEQYRSKLQNVLKCENSKELIHFYTREFHPDHDASSKIEARKERRLLAELYDLNINNYIGWLKEVASELSGKLDLEVPRTAEPKADSYRPKGLESAFKTFTEISTRRRAKDNSTAQRNTSLLRPLELARRLKISASPSYRRYLELQSESRLD